MSDTAGAAALPVPEGYEWVEVGAYSEYGDRPHALIAPHAAGWWDGHPRGAVCRGDHPLTEKRCAWERLYVLRSVEGSNPMSADDVGLDDEPPPCPRCGGAMFPVAAPDDYWDDASWIWGHDCEPD